MASSWSARRAWLAEALSTSWAPPPRTRWAATLLVFALALSVRSFYAVDLAPLMYSPQQPGTRMISRYHDVALDILKGEGVLYPRHPDPARTGLMARPPGYSLYLAAVYETLGQSLFAAQFVQNGLTSLCCVLLLWIAGRLVSWPVGMAGGVLAAIEPHMGFASNLVLPDALSALPLLLALFVLTARPEARRHWAVSLLAGAILGAGVWLRPNVVLVPPFLAVILVMGAEARRRAAAHAVVMVATAAAMVLPITLRNYVVFGEFVPVSLNGGLTVWQGVAEAGGAAYGARKRDMLVAEDEALRYGNPRYRHWWAEPDGVWRDRDRYRRAREVIRAHPFLYARLMLKRMAGMLDYADGFASFVAESGAVAAPPPEAVNDEDGAPLATIARRPSDERYLAIGRVSSFLRTPVRLVQVLLAPVLAALALAGSILLLAVKWRAALLLLSIPVYYLLTESCFLLEWRVVVPMHYGLFAGAGATFVLAAFLTRHGVARARRAFSSDGAAVARD
jgi:hypothetical protein